MLQAAAGVGVAASGLGLVPAGAGAAPLRRGDHVLAFPTTAHRLAGGALGLRIEAWVFERERNPTRTRLLARALGLDLDELPASERQRFVARTALFGADAKPGRELLLRWPGAAQARRLQSDGDGRIQAVAEQAGRAAPGSWIAWALEGDARRFDSRALWPGDEGLSVVSDIDDTIKHTEVPRTREMLLNTFAREFTAVPGMAAWYRRIAQAAGPGGGGGGGAAFHYLSGGPMQLHPALAPFLQSARFPAGSLHLRAFSLRPDALLDKDATARHKEAVLAQLLADHPRRRFVLVGDSGEQDPEVYGATARQHPGRVAAILIRRVPRPGDEAARFAQAFAGLPADAWQVFDVPEGLPVRWG